MYEKMKARVNWPVTILLFIGLITDHCNRVQTAYRDDKQHLRNPVSACTLELKQLCTGYGADRFLALPWEQPSCNDQYCSALPAPSFSYGICSGKKQSAQ